MLQAYGLHHKVCMNANVMQTNEGNLKMNNMLRHATSMLGAVRILLVWLALPLAVGTVGCGGESPLSPQINQRSDGVKRGDYVSITTPYPLEAALIGNLEVDYSSAKALGSVLRFIGVRSVATRYDIEGVRIVYKTVDPHGELINASGMLYFPIFPPGETAPPLPLVSYQHGTTATRNDIPANSAEGMVGAAFASYGYVGAAPDYIGYGDVAGEDGLDYHPYMHAESAAASVIDLLRAARQVAQKRNVALNGQIFLAGYSQGGQVTMAAHKVMARDLRDEFDVTATAPMAGPYDLSEITLARMLENRAHPAPYYSPFVVESFRRIYGWDADPNSPDYTPVDQIYENPYDEILPPLFDLTNSSETINAAMPSSGIVREAFTDNFFEAVATDLNLNPDNPMHVFRRNLRENDTYRWDDVLGGSQAPTILMRLYHCAQDDTVPFKNSAKAYEALKALGARVELMTREGQTAEDGTIAHPENIVGENFDHGQSCAFAALDHAAAWFEQLRHAKPGDTDRDGTVDFEDFLVLSNNFSRQNASWYDGDFNNDQTVDFEDFLLLSNNFNR